MVTQNVTVSIARARSGDVAAVHRFHQSQSTEFIWPRTPDYLCQLADEGSLFIALTTNTTTNSKHIVGMCYAVKGEEPEGEQRWEFGGICVSDEFRGYGLGSALGIIAISSHYLYEPPEKDERLIAHVHEDNSLPRRMLERQLGFIKVGQETPPSEVVPPELRRNAEGFVVGDLYEFKKSTLGKFADWLETFDNWIEGKSGRVTTNLNLKFFKENLAVAIEALRELASSSKTY